MLTDLLNNLPGRSFWFSLFFHAIVFFIFVFAWVHQSPPNIKPDSYVPPYIYHDEEKPTQASPQSQEVTMKKNISVSSQGIEKPDMTKTQISIPSLKQLKAVNFSKKRAAVQDEVNLIGDKKIDAPLLKLLGKALSAHLSYPKPAIDFNIRGLVTVGFLLYPDGHVTNVQLVGTSHAGVLDEASLFAVTAMSPVSQVSTFLDKPKYLVVGIIFG